MTRPPDAFAIAVKALLGRAGLSQREAAAAVGVHRTVLSTAIGGRRPGRRTVRLVEAIAAVCRASASAGCWFVSR